MIYVEGYSLPPFSPMPNGLLPDDETGRSGMSDDRGMPVTSKGFLNGCGNSNGLQPSVSVRQLMGLRQLLRIHPCAFVGSSAP